MANMMNFDYFGGGTVSSRDTLFEVNIGGYNFYVNRNAVDAIYSQNKEENPSIIASLLAYIKYVKVLSEDKKVTEIVKNCENREVTNKQLIFAVSKLLQKYTSNELIKMLSNLKWPKVYQLIISAVPQS